MIIVPKPPVEAQMVFCAPTLVKAEDADPALKYSVTLTLDGVTVSFLGCKVVEIGGVKYLALRSSSGFGVDKPVKVEFHDGAI